MVRIKPLGWLFIIGAVVAIAALSIRKFAPDLMDKVVPPKPVAESSVPPKADIPDPTTKPTAPAGSKAVAGSFPSIAEAELQPGCTDKPEVRWAHWAWNTHAGMILANGGPHAARNSSMCKAGVNLKLTREDEVPNQQALLVAFAEALKAGDPNPSKGAHFVSIMGDGGAVFFAELNALLKKKLGPEYRAQVVGSCGYSRGEDTFMGPPAWKANPQASRGGFAAGYLRDGDWNIAMKWLGDNGLCNNPDEKTFDPDCMNWVNASDYIDAAQKYVANYCEDRPVVRKGKKTGEKKKVCVNAVATWTPGDVIVAEKRGGLVRIAATDVYRYQMPNVIIGIRKWMRANPAVVDGMLSSIFDANDRIRASDGELRRASALSALVYNEADADAAYWYRYFQGAVEKDKQGLTVELGGSSVNNLADNLQLFGMVPGSANIFAATYTTFGNIAVQQYPDLIPRYPAYDDVLDTSFIARLAKVGAPATTADLPKFSSAEPVKTVVSRKAWRIRFDTGQATFSAGGEAQLDELFRDLVVAGGAVVEVHGHTDSVGNADKNSALSESRAFAVRDWLQQRSPTNFPEGRIRVFAHGQTNPVAPNDTAANKALNRRVEIVLGTTAAR